LISGRSTIVLGALLVALPHSAFPHVIPDDVAVQMFAKPEGGRLHLLVRVPFTAGRHYFSIPAGGELDLPPQVDGDVCRRGENVISD
jgi:hypothetical protein